MSTQLESTTNTLLNAFKGFDLKFLYKLEHKPVVSTETLSKISEVHDGHVQYFERKACSYLAMLLDSVNVLRSRRECNNEYEHPA